MNNLLLKLTDSLRNTANLGKLTGAVKIEIDGHGVIVADRSGVTNDDADMACVLQTSIDTFQQLLAGSLDLESALGQGKLSLSGDEDVAVSLAQAFAPVGAPRFSSSADATEIAQAIRRHGAAIVENAAPVDTIDTIASQLRPHFDTIGKEPQSDFNGYTTLRLSEVLMRSRASADLIGHDLVTAIADEILLQHCVNYRIGSCTGIEIWPGESAQRLHQDGSIYPMNIPGVEWQISALWALSDFTEENGATRLLLNSNNKITPLLRVEQALTVPAEMPKGSVLFYMGSTYHGGGANNAEAPRMALVNTYALGWLRQEENMYLSIPREVAKSYPEKIQRLMGYQSCGPLLGYIATDEHIGL